jgi:hypothetical protein
MSVGPNRDTSERETARRISRFAHPRRSARAICRRSRAIDPYAVNPERARVSRTTRTSIWPHPSRGETCRHHRARRDNRTRGRSAGNIASDRAQSTQGRFRKDRNASAERTGCTLIAPVNNNTCSTGKVLFIARVGHRGSKPHLDQRPALSMSSRSALLADRRLKANRTIGSGHSAGSASCSGDRFSATFQPLRNETASWNSYHIKWATPVKARRPVGFIEPCIPTVASKVPEGPL